MVVLRELLLVRRTTPCLPETRQPEPQRFRTTPTLVHPAVIAPAATNSRVSRGISLCSTTTGADAVAAAIPRRTPSSVAVIAEAGGTASVYGHSSGAALVLQGQRSSWPVERGSTG